jgi:hypothetical protein
MLVFWNRTDMQRTLAILALIALAGCSGGALAPAAPSARPDLQGSRARAASDASTGSPGESSAGLPGESSAGLPGESSAGLPGESSAGLPGESSAGLPGESSAGLPGASFACPGVPAAGTAACTAAINLNVPPSANPGLPAAAIPGLHPADLQSAYGLASQLPGGTVAIVDAFDDPTAEADLAVYRAAFGLPECTSANGCFRKVNQRGQSGSYPSPDTGWSAEIGLDLDMVSAACPHCSIVLVESDSALLDDLGAAVDLAVGLGAQAVSNSYYAVEWANQSAEDAHYRHNGVAITASSGDRGYPSYPASAATVTAVGGTSLSRGGSGWSETGWKYAGHGCSKYVSRPWFQAHLRCSTREAVDVSAVADPQTGVATFSTTGGGWYVAGGTSVGAPLIAAAYALSGRLTAPGYSYQRWQSFHQIDGSGYHQLTGVGSPNGLGGL